MENEMILLALILVIALPVLAYRANPERMKERLVEVFDIDGFGLRAAIIIAAPAAAIAYTICALWTGKFAGGVVTYAPLAIAAVPFVLPIAAYLTGNGKKFRASYGLRIFYGLCVVALCFVMSGGYHALMNQHGDKALMSIHSAGFLLVVIGAIGATLFERLHKIASKAASNTSKPLPRVEPRLTPMILETAKQKEYVNAQNFTVAPKLPEIKLGPGELKVPKF